MSAFLRSRAILRRHALGAGIGLSLCSATVFRQSRALLMDAHATPRAGTLGSSESLPAVGLPESRGSLNPRLMKQISGGSVAGLIAGLLVSVFSKTLVLLIGTGIVLIQVAARYGFDVVEQFKLKQRVKNSKILAALQSDPAFKVTFGTFFAMSAFMSF